MDKFSSMLRISCQIWCCYMLQMRWQTQTELFSDKVIIQSAESWANCFTLTMFSCRDKLCLLSMMSAFVYNFIMFMVTHQTFFSNEVEE